MSEKDISNINPDEKIRLAIRAIANRKLINPATGALRGTGRVTGFVARIHYDEADPLFGTIDVQEYDEQADAELIELSFLRTQVELANLSSDPDKKAQVPQMKARIEELEEREGDFVCNGYHEGVLLTAIQKDVDGYILIPKLHSEVLLSEDTNTHNEYVTLFSHVERIQLDSHDTVLVGVREREEYDRDDDDAPDVHKLKLTGAESGTVYKKDSATTYVKDANKSDQASIAIESTQIKQVIGDNLTEAVLDKKQATITHSKSSLKIAESESTLSQGNSKVKVTDGKVYVGNDSSTEDAVLGVHLANLLEEIMDALAQVMVTTQLGPQPFMNRPQFIATKAKISAFKGTHSGFLTQKVQIQK